MLKYVVLGLILLGLSEKLLAELPANAWFFSSTFRETLPDSNRQFEHGTGAQYQFGRTLGRYYSVDFGFQDVLFDHKSDADTTAQTLYNFSLRRYVGLRNRQWFFLLDAGRTISKSQGNKVRSNNVGVGLGIQQTIWKEGPSISADLRFRKDYNEISNPAYTEYDDWLLSFSMTIPLFNNSKSMRAETETQVLAKSENSSGLQVSVLDSAKFGTAAQQAQSAAARKKKGNNQNNSVGNSGVGNSGVVKKRSKMTSEEALKKNIAASIDKLRAEISALEDEEIRADFSVNSGSMIRDPDQSNKNKIERKISLQVFADRTSDTDLDGILDFKDDCPETPLGAPIDMIGCALDTDGDFVIDLLDLCESTPADVSVDERGCGFDDDVDGVPNHRDQCKNTLEDLKVNETGCEVDSDHDGIVDSKDQCESSPPGVTVEPMGCHITDIVVLKVKNFQAASPILNDSARRILMEMHKTGLRNPDLRIELTGNSNDPRISEFSRRISVGRANSAKLFLLELGTDADVKDYGAFTKGTRKPSLSLNNIPKTEKPEHDQVNMRFVTNK